MSLYRVTPNQQKCILYGCGGQEASINAEIISTVGLLSGSETTYFFSPCILIWWGKKGPLFILFIKNLV